MSESPVEFGILGPLHATVAGTPVPLGPGKHRVLLASLLVRANQVVSLDELVDRLWGENPPVRARRVIQTYVTRLRRAMGAAGRLVITRPPGYLLEAGDGLDSIRFRAHVQRAELARAAGALETEAAELRAALALWRGEPLADVPSESLRRDEIPRLAEERLQALDRRIDVDLELGRHAAVVTELYGLTRAHPLRENLWAQLMLALHRSGRRADALRAFQDVRGILRDELGIDPGDRLRAIHLTILTADPDPGSPPAGERRAPARQLPADVGDFVGREELIRAITTLVGGESPAAPVVILAGPPGIGKTALAVRAAHRLAARFAGGQLYVNLRGHSAGPPMAAGDALARFLRALGVPPDQVPAELDEQSTLFRSTVAGRRIMVVLDDAVSPDQVRPLLPGDPSCPVLVTSRNDLRGLTAINGARRLPVGVLSTTESIALLTGLLGPAPVGAEPAAARRLAELCGHLPLALRIAAANLADGPHGTIADYVGHLGRADRIAEVSVRPAAGRGVARRLPSRPRRPRARAGAGHRGGRRHAVSAVARAGAGRAGPDPPRPRRAPAGRRAGRARRRDQPVVRLPHGRGAGARGARGRPRRGRSPGRGTRGLAARPGHPRPRREPGRRPDPGPPGRRCREVEMNAGTTTM